MSYHKPASKRGRSANRRLSMRGMSAARHDFEIMNSIAKRAGEPPPSFIAQPCGCSAECTFVHNLKPKEAVVENTTDQRRWWPIESQGSASAASAPHAVQAR